MLTSCSPSTAVFLILVQDKGVGHAGNVVADDAGQRFLLCLFLVLARERFGVVHPEGKEVGNYTLGFLLLLRECGTEIEIGIKEFLALLSLGFYGGTEARDALGM